MNLILANCELLEQGRTLLSRHDDQSFVAGDPASYGSGIGVHFRHVLDHYLSFVKGLDSGLIDYDARVRNTNQERSVELSLQVLERVRDQLSSLELDIGRAIRVKVSASTEGEDVHSKSSVGRELQFLVSHTVHHYALIAIASRMLGIFPDESFGVAPSTLKYLKSVGN
ncbi:hypothetical protein [Pelagicoccus sp. SDUM812003]|uniref:hypothetical protein n=1 Tax=Pelagicoccus sp. SDUM812003 TaxID=3041267 RepID=UPI00280D64F5|nr:hypothetical protein [Pelagicoccus sp. SDUM812003]MDQ8203272.1 hypothetical protein [Pelagicoccus sp. SDUM812003]